MGSSRRWSAATREALKVAVICTMLAAASMGAAILSVSGSMIGSSEPMFSPAYRPPQNRLEVRFDLHDGQASAALAMDPTLARPEIWPGGESELAYRASRPVIGWLGWLGSFGRPGAVAWALTVISVVSVGLLGYAAARFAQMIGRRGDLMVSIFVLPGTVAVAVFPGLCDALASALALLGVVAWLGGRRAVGVALFVVAALSRETTLLLPLALAASELVKRRRLDAPLPLAVPFVAYGAWISVVRLRVGEWGVTHVATLGTPLHGLIDRTQLGWTSAGVAAAVIGGVLVVGAMFRKPPAVYVWSAVLFGLVALAGTAQVWADWDTGMPRALLPLQVMALASVLPRSSADQPV